MSKNTIEYLAYLLDKAKNDGKDKAIFFLGAGASVTAGIPLTPVIVRHIKLKFRKNPIIKDKNDYYELMGALTADERRDLFHFYVTRDKVKLNLANVYLAQLLKLGYIDYILTVNFDDLILKACTLYNFLPPVYDVSNIKTITTTDIRTGSVIYLHGQYFGQWLLNNNEELTKVEEEVLGLFNTIKTRRTWVVVGYSGNDGIFEKIKSLGSFSNEFFWVKKEINNSEDSHIIKFLGTPNVNANKIEGFYADSFFLKLHAELSKLNKNLSQPDLFYKPFTHLKSIMQNVNEINEKDELSIQIKGFIESCNNRIEKAIAEFETKDSIEDFIQKIIDAILKSEFSDSEVQSFEHELINKNYTQAKKQLSWYYGEWGNSLYNLANSRNDENLFTESIQKYKKAIGLYPNDETSFNNWGTVLLDLAKLKKDEALFYQSLEKYKKASELNSKDYFIFYNWGTALSEFAKLKQNETLFRQSMEKYEKANELNPKDNFTLNNWGKALSDLAKLSQDENLYQKAENILKKGIELGGNKYNLACLYAVKNEKEKAFTILKQALNEKEITTQFVLEEDDDWNDYKDDTEFKELIKTINI